MATDTIKKTPLQPGRDIVTTMGIEVLGVILFTGLAGIDDNLGNVLVAIMWGLLLLWCLTHTSQLAGMVKHL